MTDALKEFNRRYAETIGRTQGLDSVSPPTQEQDELEKGMLMAQVFGDQQRFGGFGNQEMADLNKPIEAKFELLKPMEMPGGAMPRKQAKQATREPVKKPGEDTDGWLTKFRKALYNILTTPETRKKAEQDRKAAHQMADEQFEEFLIKEELRAKGVVID